MRHLSRSLIQLVITVLAGGFLSASLVRFSPGYGTSEEQLDTRRSAASVQRLLDERQERGGIAQYYVRFVAGYLSGDLGRSSAFERPVRELIAERAPKTIAAGALGLGLAWAFSTILSFASLASRRVSMALMIVSTGCLQCVPAGVVALSLFLLGYQGARAAGLAVGILVYPRVSQYLLNILNQAWEAPHVTLARAKGIEEWRVLLVHVVPVCTPQLLSLLGLSVALAMGAVIPVEAILDVSGVGQLAWQAALARDMNLLVNITVVVTVVITVCNILLEIASRVLVPNREAVA